MASPLESPQDDESQSLSPARLTPKSKVRNLLAAFDNEADDGIGHVPAQPLLSVNVSPRTARPRDSAEDISATTGPSENENDDDSDGDIVARPRGRIAARMHAGQAKDTDRCPATGITQEHEKEIGSVERATSGDSGSNNNDASSIFKRRKIRNACSSTPKSNISNHAHNPLTNACELSPSNRSPVPATDESDLDDSLPMNPGSNTRFLALVHKMREERLAKEEDAARQKAAKAAERAKFHSSLSEEADAEFSDDDETRRLTNQSRPTRKASKKALEDMSRETQRISRNMQLAHEARTKKKISKASLFEKFNYRSAKSVEKVGAEQAPSGSSSSAVQSDVELNETPPTSPISHSGRNTKPKSLGTDHRTSELDINGNPNPEGTTCLSPSRLKSKLCKGKEKAAESPSHLLSNKETAKERATTLNARSIHIRPLKNLDKSMSVNSDSDSDLEIVATQVPVRRTIDSIFDRIPTAQTKESHSLQTLRVLAHLTSPGKQTRHGFAKASLTVSEMQISLRQQARKQAAREREERLQALRDRGVIVQTAEEKEKEMADLENLIAKARREAEEIMKREKDASKKERNANAEENALESSDDEEWEEKENPSLSESQSGDEGSSGEEEECATLSASETEETEAKLAGSFIDNEVFESETAGGEITVSDSEIAENSNDNDDELPITLPRRRVRQLVISDDENEHSVPNTDSPLTRQPKSPMAPSSVLRSATKTFIPGLAVAGPAGLGLTQIFAGTMDDSQVQDSPVPPRTRPSQLGTSEDSLAFLRNLPAPSLPAFEPTIADGSHGIVRNGQTQTSCVPESPLGNRTSQNIHLRFSQSEEHGPDNTSNPLATQVSDFPEPTQDTGFQAITPIKGRFSRPYPSTIDTVIQNTPDSENNDVSPVTKKGRLQRRRDVLVSSEETKSQKRTNVGDIENLADAFDVMRRASKEKPLQNFDRNRSSAKEMVEEQAQESEDEYAGLGGASDDDSAEEEDEYVKEMIDDESGNIDESKLAAFYADRERANDEKQVEKLFKDIANGMLRRKRGADYDLSDSDDDGEARRRMKQREFARMRKALLEDERIGKIAENPKKSAFLRAIEDRGEDDEIDFLDYDPEPQEAIDSAQSQPQLEERNRYSLPNSITSLGKRKSSDDAEPEILSHPRRVKLNKRPSSLVEIRDSLFSLIEEPNDNILAQDSGPEFSSEDEHPSVHGKEEKENRDPFSYRRTKGVSVVDRISLKRASSSNLSATSARLAFDVSSTPAFKAPALLRRATANSSGSGTSASTNDTERTAGAFGDEGRSIVKKAGRNSGINYFTRENERKMAVKAGEKRREQKMCRTAEKRRKAVGGIFGGGKFD